MPFSHTGNNYIKQPANPNEYYSRSVIANKLMEHCPPPPSTEPKRNLLSAAVKSHPHSFTASQLKKIYPLAVEPESNTPRAFQFPTSRPEIKAKELQN